MRQKFLIIFLITLFFFCREDASFCQVGDNITRGAAVSVEALPEDLRELDIKDYFVGSNTKEVGVIKTMTGHVIVRHEDSGMAWFAVAGDKIFEKDSVFTIEKSRCRLKFFDDNLITMGDDTKINIQEIIIDQKLREKKSIINMVRGKAMFYALKLLKYRKASMTVKTKTAVCGIRGTKFGIEIRENAGGLKASRPVYLADASNTGMLRISQAGSDGSGTIGSYTVVYSFDGTVTVTSSVTGDSVKISAGEFVNMFTTGAGEVKPTPEGLSKLFQDDTSSPDDEADNKDKDKDKDEGKDEDKDGGKDEDQDDGKDEDNNKDNGDDKSGDEGEKDKDKEFDNFKDDFIDTTNEQNTKKEDEKDIRDPVEDPGTNATGLQVGYLTGMLTNTSDDELTEVFISKTRQDFNNDNVWSRGTKDSEDYIRADSGFAGNAEPYAKWVAFHEDNPDVVKDSGDLGDGYPVTHTELGHVSGGSNNEYLLEWSYWTVPNTFTVDGKTYNSDNRGYCIFGDDTASMSELNTGTATYSGNAWGTYWSSDGGADMGPDDYVPEGTGTFSCDVDFVTALITDFDLSVSGNDHTASIEDATGNFTDSSYFTISGGTWSLDGTVPDDQLCYGSFYGDTADYIGGAWAMYDTDENTGAEGIFKGDKIVRKGYFTAMLEKEEDGVVYCVDSFISKSLQDFNSNDSRATHNYDYIKVDGENYSDQRVVMVNQGSDVHSWTGAEIMQITQIDFDSHMEWGYWEQPNAMSINNIDHFIRNKGYYVWGDYTQNMPESGNYTYSGNAYGTYWTADGGVDMGPAEDVAGGTGGIFSADVNFSSGEVTNFELSVSGNDYSASISNGEGWIDNYTSKFQLGSGTYSINSNDDASGSAFGSFYGDDAADMGGVWQINNGSAHVTGSFVSTDKQGEAPR